MRGLRGVVSGVAVAVGLMGLVACSEREQTASSPVKKKSDSRASDGTSNGHMVSGWKAGDADSWDQHLRVRAQAQNEYARSSAQ